MMNLLPDPFNIVCIESMIHDFYDAVKPIDTALDNSSTLNDPKEIWIRLVDRELAVIEWQIDGDVGDNIADARALLMGYARLTGDEYAVDVAGYELILGCIAASADDSERAYRPRFKNQAANYLNRHRGSTLRKLMRQKCGD